MSEEGALLELHHNTRPMSPITRPYRLLTESIRLNIDFKRPDPSVTSRYQLRKGGQGASSLVCLACYINSGVQYLCSSGKRPAHPMPGAEIRIHRRCVAHAPDGSGRAHVPNGNQSAWGSLVYCLHPSLSNDYCVDTLCLAAAITVPRRGKRCLE